MEVALADAGVFLSLQPGFIARQSARLYLDSLAALADLHGRHAQQRHDDDECRDQRHNGPGLALGGSDDQHHGQQYGSMDESARVFGFGGQSLKLQHLDA